MGSSWVFMRPSCHLNHKVKKCGSKSGQERENQEGGGVKDVYSFSG